ncbi:methyltransferase [Ferruginibacter sp.]
MNLFKYIRYFFYLAYNWNFKIAAHITRKEIKGEKKYGIDTTGADELGSLRKKGIDTDHSTIYMPVSYDVLEDVFDRVKANNHTHFLDIGCGKGRTLCVAAYYDLKKVTGIDFSKAFCTAAEKNLLLTKNKFPQLQYRVFNNDAFYYEIPADVDCIFMFNPFDEVIMSGVAENILTSFEEHPRKISLIYANPLHKEELLNIGFKEVYHTKKMNYLEAVILELQ